MSRLYGSVGSDTAKKEATRRGHKSVTGHVRGWASGVKVVAKIYDDLDEFEIYATRGSDQSTEEEFIGVVHLVKGKPKFLKRMTWQKKIYP